MSCSEVKAGITSLLPRTPDPTPTLLLSLCGFGFMLGCKIKAKEIKRLPLAGKANSDSLLLEGRGWEGGWVVVVMEPPLAPGPSPSCWEPRPGSPSLPVALSTLSPLGASVPKDRVGRGAELESECQPGLRWVLKVRTPNPRPAVPASAGGTC